MCVNTRLCGSVLGMVLIVSSAGPIRGAPEKEESLPPEATWVLLRDFKLDGQLKEPLETKLQLTAKEGKMAGHFVGKKALDKEDDSAFRGETVVGELSHLLILRQEKKGDGNTYVVIHIGQPIGPNHYRGTWHDTSGNAGDFELKVDRK
jgi:hypothetical protein